MTPLAPPIAMSDSRALGRCSLLCLWPDCCLERIHRARPPSSFASVRGQLRPSTKSTKPPQYAAEGQTEMGQIATIQGQLSSWWTDLTMQSHGYAPVCPCAACFGAPWLVITPARPVRARRLEEAASSQPSTLHSLKTIGRRRGNGFWFVSGRLRRHRSSESTASDVVLLRYME